MGAWVERGNKSAFETENCTSSTVDAQIVIFAFNAANFGWIFMGTAKGFSMSTGLSPCQTSRP